MTPSRSAAPSPSPFETMFLLNLDAFEEKAPLKEPKSSIPNIILSSRQETEYDRPRFWPDDLSLLGISNEERDVIDHAVRNAFRAHEFQWGKKEITYQDPITKDSVITKLALSIFVLQSQATLQCFLFPKTLFMIGGERKIKWCYDLLSGVFFLKKRLIGPFENIIYSMLTEKRTQRGIDSALTYIKKPSKKTPEKVQIIESIRDGEITSLFATLVMESFSSKKKLIQDYLEDLATLHQMTFYLTCPKTNQLITYQGFHHDLKPENMLVHKQKGLYYESWRGELCDFGSFAASLAAWVFSIGYTPPEYIQFYQEEHPLGLSKKCETEDPEKIISFNLLHAQKRDIWSMGLCLLSIVVGRNGEAIWTKQTLNSPCEIRSIIPPLKCIKECIEKFARDAAYEETGILTITQEMIDVELDELEQEVLKMHPYDLQEVKKHFKLIKMMVQINPEERQPIAKILM